jgi:hypothetical protein
MPSARDPTRRGPLPAPIPTAAIFLPSLMRAPRLLELRLSLLKRHRPGGRVATMVQVALPGELKRDGIHFVAGRFTVGGRIRLSTRLGG